MRSPPSPEIARLRLAIPALQLYTKADAVLNLASEIFVLSTNLATESLRLARKVSLITHLLEEIQDFAARSGCRAASTSSVALACLADLELALEAVKKFLLLSCRQSASGSSNLDSMAKGFQIQYQYVTWQLEKVLGKISYEHFEISNEVQEEVELVLTQLRREIEKTGVANLNVFQEFYNMLSSSNDKEIKQHRSFKLQDAHSDDANAFLDGELRDIVVVLAAVNGKDNYDIGEIMLNLMDRLERVSHVDVLKTEESGISSSNSASCSVDNKQHDSREIPEDFLCSISLELMRDPVIVSTGQTYERSSIQRWIDCGNHTCPKTQQKLKDLRLTPNHVLRSLIMQWCEANKFEQPYRLASSCIRTDRKFQEINGERSLMNTLVSKLSSSSRDEQRSAAAELRSLAKRSTNNRMLLAEVGAIPALVNLLSADDRKTQEHAVTSLLNLSICDHNKEVILLAGAIPSIVHVLRVGSMEARENASATIFSLSLNDENRISIGGTPGIIEALVELLVGGSPRGKKDAATALFNLCKYQGNKSRAVRAGIVSHLVKMLKDSSTSGMVDEILTILSILVSHREGKAAISKANTIPVLIDLLRSGQQRNKENAAAILLALCRKDCENLACMGRLGAVIPLTEISKTGTERARRKATSLLELLQKLQIL